MSDLFDNCPDGVYEMNINTSCPNGKKTKIFGIREIEEWWNNKPDVDSILKRPILGHWVEVTDWLIRRVKGLEGRKYYWNCPTHGQSQNPWGCPDCVREMGEHIKELEGEIELWKDWPTRLTGLKYCKEHKAICLPFNNNLACCLERKIKELEGEIERIEHCLYR